MTNPPDTSVTERVADTHDLKWAIVRAYVQGAEDAHNHYEEDRDPDFKEAGCDYAESIDLAAISSMPANARLREALQGLEAANDALCGKRSQETYLRMIDTDKCADELLALDEARRAARAALTSTREGLSGGDK